jgi:cob(I)alamin adenosyltransferase
MNQIKRKPYKNTTKINNHRQKFQTSLSNLKSYINNKYHYTQNKKGYNQLLAIHNGLKWLYNEVEFDTKNKFVKNVDALILQLCIDEYNQNKK